MHVGVFPITSRIKSRIGGLPHARGGVSSCIICLVINKESSPCTWGCFLELVEVWAMTEVFPMHVGVFPPKRHC